MRDMSAEKRQGIACGYEPRVPHGMPASPAAMNSAWTGPRSDDGKYHLPTVCPGYTTSLPAVQEIALARMHWGKGGLRDFCVGQPSDHMLRGIEILEGADREREAWVSKNPVSNGS